MIALAHNPGGSMAADALRFVCGPGDAIDIA
jgi:hypothetical protein